MLQEEADPPLTRGVLMLGGGHMQLSQVLRAHHLGFLGLTIKTTNLLFSLFRLFYLCGQDMAQTSRDEGQATLRACELSGLACMHNINSGGVRLLGQMPMRIRMLPAVRALAPDQDLEHGRSIWGRNWRLDVNERSSLVPRFPPARARKPRDKQVGLGAPRRAAWVRAQAPSSIGGGPEARFSPRP